MIDHLTQHGVMMPESLYESPFTDLAPQGPEALFSSQQIDQIVAALAEVRATVIAA